MSYQYTERGTCFFSIKETDPFADDRQLNYNKNTQTLTVTFLPKDAPMYEFIDELFIADACNNTEGRVPPDYGLQRNPQTFSFTFTKNLPKALNFLHSRKQITQQQKNEMKEHIKPQKTPTVFKSDKNTANTPADENESSNNSCCNSM